ncbi:MULTISPECIES: hypothetical protein [unclassified Streptomyces]|uniref:hypothetical protein n=1 Tax=unclassified Streptomyces TaxID=2593676 RepID=UPI0033FC5E66
MDIRVKTFAAEARSRFGVALEGLGFASPEVDQSQETYPLVMHVRYHRGDVTVDTSLVLAYAGEEYVHTSLLWAGASPSRARSVTVGEDTAHTGYQMRRALDKHAQAAPDLITRRDCRD